MKALKKEAEAAQTETDKKGNRKCQRAQFKGTGDSHRQEDFFMQRGNVYYLREGLISTKIKQMEWVSKQRRFVKRQGDNRSALRQKWLPCCLIGQLAMAYAVKDVQKKAGTGH